MRLNARTLRPKWTSLVPTFNVSKGLTEANFAYFGGSGFAAKLDLNSGRYVWKHDDFYRKYDPKGAFNAFEVPEIDGETVVFKELVENSKPNVISFQKESGSVVRVDIPRARFAPGNR